MIRETTRRSCKLGANSSLILSQLQPYADLLGALVICIGDAKPHAQEYCLNNSLQHVQHPLKVGASIRRQKHDCPTRQSYLPRVSRFKHGADIAGYLLFAFKLSLLLSGLAAAQDQQSQLPHAETVGRGMAVAIHTLHMSLIS